MKVVNKDNRKGLTTYGGELFDACVTDPPYELGFMGKAWDATGIAYDVEFWKLVFKVMKPGAYLLAFGGTRTYHRMTCAIEDAGFEIRDCIQWLYGSGFPKSLNISKELDKAMGVDPKVVGTATYGDGHIQRSQESIGYQGCDPDADRRNITEPVTRAAKKWKGWGSALKPANEPIVVARKPLAGTLVANVSTHGVGGINIDGCRVGTENGRWPANVIMDEQAGAMLDAQAGNRPGMSGGGKHREDYEGGMFGSIDAEHLARSDNGGPSRFFYSPKASRSEREAGLEEFDEESFCQGYKPENSPNRKSDIGLNRTKERANVHPTVKPISLMQWLVRLVTPQGGKVLDPFAGSGTTGIACVREGFEFLGFEKNRKYTRIANSRIKAEMKKR